MMDEKKKKEWKELGDKALKACGFCFIFLVMWVTVFYFFPVPFSNVMTKMTSTYIGSSLTYLANRNSEALRTISLGITERCYDYPCRAYTLFDELYNRQRYTLTLGNNVQVQDPLYTYLIGAGDCKSQSVLYSAMYNSLGGTSEVQCVTDHCWNVVYFDNNITMIVDMANKITTTDIKFFKEMILDENYT